MPTEESPPAGELPARYRPLSPIGRGGMGTIIRAIDLELNREVALKVSLFHRQDRRARSRFLREAQTLAALEHPRIVRIYDCGDTGSALYLAMELLEGATLAELIAAGAVELDTAVELLHQALEGLEFVHGRQILHRDLKPANVFVRDTGVVLIDFGIARTEGLELTPLTADNEVVGTLLFLAPEIIRGASASVASDLFSVGAIAFELLTGKSLHSEDMHKEGALSQLLSSLSSGAYHDLAASKLRDSPLRDFLLQSISPDPALRFDSATAMRAALRAWREARQEASRPPTGAVTLPNLLAQKPPGPRLFRQATPPAIAPRSSRRSVWLLPFALALALTAIAVRWRTGLESTPDSERREFARCVTEAPAEALRIARRRARSVAGSPGGEEPVPPEMIAFLVRRLTATVESRATVDLRTDKKKRRKPRNHDPANPSPAGEILEALEDLLLCAEPVRAGRSLTLDARAEFAVSLFLLSHVPDLGEQAAARLSSLRERWVRDFPSDPLVQLVQVLERPQPLSPDQFDALIAAWSGLRPPSGAWPSQSSRYAWSELMVSELIYPSSVRRPDIATRTVAAERAWEALAARSMLCEGCEGLSPRQTDQVGTLLIHSVRGQAYQLLRDVDGAASLVSPLVRDRSGPGMDCAGASVAAWDIQFAKHVAKTPVAAPLRLLPEWRRRARESLPRLQLLLEYSVDDPSGGLGATWMNWTDLSGTLGSLVQVAARVGLRSELERLSRSRALVPTTRPDEWARACLWAMVVQRLESDELLERAWRRLEDGLRRRPEAVDDTDPVPVDQTLHQVASRLELARCAERLLASRAVLPARAAQLRSSAVAQLDTARALCPATNPELNKFAGTLDSLRMLLTER